MKKICLLVLLLTPIFWVRPALAIDSFAEFLKEGTPYVDFRFRYEFVDQDGLAADAHSKTLRTRIGYKTAVWKNFVALLEGENVVYLANDDFNDTNNGKTDHPTVADPENTQVNQANVEFTGIKDTSIKAGRQVITVDNHRFIGHVGWRQNNQVFDAVALTNTSIPDTTIKYGYIYNVNRIFGEDSSGGDWNSKSNYYNISNTSTPLGKITTYGYFLDFGSDSAVNSNRTYGLSISGKTALNDDVTLKYYGEYALQSDYAENTTDYDANYYHIAPALVWKGLTATVGYEVLGSDDSQIAFRTPLATLHKFNGWSDKFLVTPAAGLEDFYIDLTYKVSGVEGAWECLNGLLAKLKYHDFSANDGGADYGNEIGLFLKKPINKNVWTSVKLSSYNTDGFATDTQKATIDLGVKF